jgi:hypothetical protein
VPVFATEVEAVAALDQWMRCHQAASTAAPRPFTLSVGVVAGATSTLDEATSLTRLARAGVPVVPHQVCADEDAVVAAFTAFGAPVALKGCTARVAHKSDVGLVELGLRTEDEVRAAYARVVPTLRRLDPDAPGVLVAPMATGRFELMIGARIDPVFGPMIVVGVGGAYVEVLPDVQVLLLPVRPEDVLAALARLRIAPLLRGVRGERPADVGCFADAAVAVSRLLGEDSGVLEVDVNPVILGSEGDGCLAVDAVVSTRHEGRGVAGPTTVSSISSI